MQSTRPGLARARLYIDDDPRGKVVTFVLPDAADLQMTEAEANSAEFWAALVAEAVHRYRFQVSMAALDDVPSAWEFHVDVAIAQSWLQAGNPLPDLRVGSVLASWQQ